jgi:hypothetical protein
MNLHNIIVFLTILPHTEQADVAAMLQKFIQEVLGWNFGGVPEILTESFLDFRQSLQTTTRIVPQITHGRFLSIQR